MATIAATSLSQSVPFTVTTTALGAGSNTLTYTAGIFQTLELTNTTGASINVTLTGSASTTVTPPGYGGTVSVSGGKVIAVPANSVVAVRLDAISAFLQGTVTVTQSATGVTAVLYYL